LRRIIYSILGLAFIIIVAGGCSTSKNTWSRRAYHNVNSYFNAYYNGDLAYREGMKKMNEETKDNYSLIIPVFPYSNKGNSSIASTAMDRAFKKGSKAIQKHSITARPEKRPKSTKKREFYDQPEFVKWTWHSYLLVGKSHFIKRDFYAAIESFSFIIKTYSMLPIKYDAQLWLARTYTEMGSFKRADPIFKLMEGTSDFPERLERDLNLVKADYHLKQNELELAAVHLELAVKLTKRKSEVYRYQFILGQIYQQLGDDRNANEKYSLVMRRNRNYEMSFNARVNLAQISSKNERDNAALKRELLKMARDDKNIEYLDQLYFALGKIADNEGKKNDAKELYLKSAHASKANKNQKGQSYLELGILYLAEPEYVKANTYLDSAMTLVSKEIPDYKTYFKLSLNLRELVENITLVETQDSLQRMAAMSEAERNALADAAIADIARREREEKAREQMDRLAASQMQQQTRTLDQGVGGGFYFYNPATQSAGAIQFQAKWGNRTLEDDWRRANKTTTNFDVFSSEPQTVANVEEDRVTDKTSREFYLQDVPLTDSAMHISDSLIHLAMYKTASIYKDKIEDLQKAQESYLVLLKRFPESIHELESWYFLYKIYEIIGESAKSEQYKNEVIRKYPLSKYAQSMTNPDFFKQETKKEQESRFLYATTYKMFANERFEKVLDNCVFADSAYPGSPYQAKFSLLKAISTGRTTDSITFVRELEKYIASFPNAPEVGYAKDIKRYLTGPPVGPTGVEKKSEQGLLAEKEKVVEKAVEYIYDAKAKHYYATLVYNQRTNANRLKFNLSNMNIDYFPMFEFEVVSELFSADINLISVRDFKDGHTAMNYYYSIIYVDEVYAGLTKLDYRQFVITEDNFKKLMETKAIITYFEFFEENYKKE